jgi:hypothetical protein
MIPEPIETHSVLATTTKLYKSRRWVNAHMTVPTVAGGGLCSS